MVVNILLFLSIAIMRVIQKICSKQTSNEISDGVTFFKYGAYYQFWAAIFSLIALFIVGFNGLDSKTWICAGLSAILFAIELFSSIEVIKGCDLIVATMFSLGGLIICCVAGVFLFDEKMSPFQIIGLVMFFVSAYLLTPSNKKNDNNYEKKKISFKTFVLLIISFLSNGLIMVVQKYFSLRVENGNVALFSFLIFILNAIILFVGYVVSYFINKNKQVQTSEKEKKHTPWLSKILLICGLLLAFAIFVINYIVTYLGKSISSAILFPVSSAITVLITAFVGLFVYKEKLSVKNIIGVTIGLASIIVISLF